MLRQMSEGVTNGTSPRYAEALIRAVLEPRSARKDRRRRRPRDRQQLPPVSERVAGALAELYGDRRPSGSE
jgi:hypothetical protein